MPFKFSKLFSHYIKQNIKIKIKFIIDDNISPLKLKSNLIKQKLNKCFKTIEKDVLSIKILKNKV